MYYRHPRLLYPVRLDKVWLIFHSVWWPLIGRSCRVSLSPSYWARATRQSDINAEWCTATSRRHERPIYIVACCRHVCSTWPQWQIYLQYTVQTTVYFFYSQTEMYKGFFIRVDLFLTTVLSCVIRSKVWWPFRYFLGRPILSQIVANLRLSIKILFSCFRHIG